jgi:cobalt-zinc-cadmium efflux system protein
MSRTRRLIVVLVLNLSLVAGLLIVGLAAHSLAVLAAGGDYILDAAGVGVALLAIRLAARPAGVASRRGNYQDPSRIAALINAGWLLALELIVAATAAGRLLGHTPTVDGLPVLIVSGIAALVMSVGALILRADAYDGDGQDGERDPSVAAVLLDTIADAAAAAAVAVTGGIILATRGWYWLDPSVALAIAVVVAYHAVKLIRKVLGQPRPAASTAAPNHEHQPPPSADR